MNVEIFLEPLKALLGQVGAFAPRLAMALLVMLAGWLFAKAVRFALVKGLRAINFKILTERAGIDGFLAHGGIEIDATGIFGILVYWLVLLAAAVIAFNGMGLTYITDLLSQVVQFVPKVIVALLIIIFGAYFARFIAGSVTAYCKNIGVSDAELLGKMAQYAIVVFVVLISLDHLNVGGTIIRETFLIVIAGIVLALALAFGLGGKRWAAERLERWWPSSRSNNEK